MNTKPSSSSRLAGTLTALGGIAATVLGVGAAIDLNFVGAAWFAIAGVAMLLIVPGLLRLRTSAAAEPIARGALVVSAVSMTLFGLSHFYGMFNEDVAVLLFSVFMLIESIALIVAGVVIVLRTKRRSWSSWLPLVCGAWPVLTVPAGAALGDVPHFTAIAVWGLTWIAFGRALRADTILSSSPTTEHAERAQLQPN